MSYNNKQVIVRQVWAFNLLQELHLIRTILPFYSLASFDTEFPGSIFTLDIDNRLYSKLSPTNNYHLMKANVDALNIIQLGLTLSDSIGNLPDFGTPFNYIWQFNFCDFDIDRDPHNVESITLLQQQGIDFVKNKKEGIPSHIFRFLLEKTGVLFILPCITWITFRGSHDFGYLIKILIGRELPYHLHEFNSLLVHYFGPRIYDMKHMMKFCNGLYGGLESLAKTLKVDRVAGKSHQAGSDSLLTLQTFMKLKDVYFEENYGKESLIVGVLHGLEMNRLNPVHLNFNKFCSLLKNSHKESRVRESILIN